MAIVPTNLADHYVLIAEFQGVGGTQPWRSEFHIQGATGSIPPPGSLIVNAARDYWLHNLRTDATLANMQLRNWTYGPQPFSANSLPIWVQTVNMPGAKTFTYGAEGPNPAGREVVAFIRITTSGARPGKQFLRYLLDEVDITAVSGGEWELDTHPPANFTAATYHADAALTIGPFNASATPPRFCVVHFSPKRWNANPVPANAPFSTPLTDIIFERPGVNKSTRKNKR